jgi:hypothetical protein
MWVIGSGLSDGKAVEADVVSFPHMLMGYNARCTALGHVGRVCGPKVKSTSVAIEVELNEPAVSVDVNVDAFDVDGGVKRAMKT